MSYFQNIKNLIEILDSDQATKNDLVKRTFVADGEHLTANIVIFGDSGNAIHAQQDPDELLVMDDNRCNMYSQQLLKTLFQ